MIEKLQNTDLATAMKMKAVFQVSYAIEAKLLNAVDFPPLKRKIEGYTNSENTFFGFLVDDQIAGVIEIATKDTAIHIQSLVVDPQFFRRGIAKKLIGHILQDYDAKIITVETGAANEPASRLYEKSGFVEIRQYDTDHGIRKVCFEMRRG
ncbi:MAG: ribosomal protein S18 acetylase RimI-like enzyme [Crocinitomix sp.]|jgi:ribosomal protein S18 acetylase RimI-like enzyme